MKGFIKFLNGRCPDCNASVPCVECLEQLQEHIEKEFKKPQVFDENDMTVGEYYNNVLKPKEDAKKLE